MSARLDGDTLDNTESARSSPSSSSSQPRVPPKKHYPALPPIDGDDFEASDEEEYVKSFPYFIKNVMSKNGYMGHPQFVGKSSSFVLVQQVLDMKESVTDSTSATNGSRERDYFQGVCVEAWRDTPVSSASSAITTLLISTVSGLRPRYHTHTARKTSRTPTCCLPSQAITSSTRTPTCPS